MCEEAMESGAASEVNLGRSEALRESEVGNLKAGLLDGGLKIEVLIEDVTLLRKGWK